MDTKKNLVTNKNEEENKKERLKRFQRINENFTKYKMRIFWITFFYILFYAAWMILSNFLVQFLKSMQYNKTTTGGFAFVVKFIHFIFIGFLFSLDGVVSGLVKTPMGQLNYEINHAASSGFLTGEQKEDLASIITLANEYSRETFRKFGVLAICSEAAKLTMDVKSVTEGLNSQNGEYWWLFVISYIIPMGLCFHKLFAFQKLFRYIEKGQFKAEKISEISLKFPETLIVSK